MCTLALAWRAFDDAPVAVAANRDERLDRAAQPPHAYARDPLVIAPSDAEAGGTWIGVNEHGVFAGITNRWVDRPLAGERSRGLLVADALEHGTAAEAVAAVEAATAAREYEGFNLVIADAEDAVVIEWDGDLHRTDLDPGVHVVVNVGVDDTFEIPADRPEAGERQAATARSLRAVLAVDGGRDDGEAGDGEAGDDARAASAWLERAGRVLGDHEYGVCVHGDGFGTRSSSLIALGSRPAYLFAAGPPCRTPYEPIGLEGHI